MVHMRSHLSPPYYMYMGTHLRLVLQEKRVEVAERGILHDNSWVGHLGDATDHSNNIGVGSGGNLHHHRYLIVEVVQLELHPLRWETG